MPFWDLSIFAQTKESSLDLEILGPCVFRITVVIQYLVLYCMDYFTHKSHLLHW